MNDTAREYGIKLGPIALNTIGVQHHIAKHMRIGKHIDTTGNGNGKDNARYRRGGQVLE